MNSNSNQQFPQKREYDFHNEYVKEFPRMVIAGISFACNARCIHCIYSTFPETKKKYGWTKFIYEG